MTHIRKKPSTLLVLLTSFVNSSSSEPSAMTELAAARPNGSPDRLRFASNVANNETLTMSSLQHRLIFTIFDAQGCYLFRFLGLYVVHLLAHLILPNTENNVGDISDGCFNALVLKTVGI
jgi:hypothetical protein